jgi:subtilisin family serine protease
MFMLVGALSSFSLAQASQSQLPDPPADQVAVKLRQGVAINTILSRYDASLLGTISETNLYFLRLPAGQTANQVLPTLAADPDLFYAEPNYYAEGKPGAGVIIFHGHGTLTPAPPGGGDQWAWIKTRLADAQKISTGQGIIVAVLDTGLAPDHPLLNSSLTAGYDFVGMTNNIYDTGNNLDDDGDSLMDEDVGHGTHVSGIIVTAAPGVQIMPIRVLNSDGVGTYWEVAAGIRYAVDHGARIINMSLSAPRLTPSLADALNYAKSRGVLVVSAAGVGAGPNYPAGHPDRTTVLGVGATDQNDSIAWFSGGQTSDTDVYAPGVDIYSAFPYNSYGLGSGTSMAAPMVAGEAALLMSRYPGWSLSQVTQRILDKVDPVSGAAAGRIDLADAVTTGLRVDYAPTDFGVPQDNHIKPRLRVVNNTPETIPLSQLTIRYWYTIDSDQGQSFSCDYTSVGCGNISGAFTRLPDGSPNKTGTSDSYLEVRFNGNPGVLPGGGWIDLSLRFNKNDWSNYNESNDYSYDPGRIAPAEWNRVTLYRNGVTVWGAEPGTTPQTPSATVSSPTPVIVSSTATQTPAPTLTATQTPSRTPTATQVPTQAPTATQTPTKTPTATQLPTATPAATQTSTNLPSPPTISPSSTASASSLKVQYMTLVTGSSSQAIAPQLILFNTGTTDITLSEITLRYWFTIDGDKPQSYWCDYFYSSCGNVIGRFVRLSAPRSGADTCLEISFAAGAGVLAYGANTGPLQNRFSKNDWSFYTQTGDYSFDPTKSQFADWSKVTIYRNGVLVWGVEP